MVPRITAPVVERVETAIASAARRTGVDFGYLLAQAKVESGLNPAARARTSSAAGLFQFIDSTWLATVKRHGAAHGLAWAADLIGQAGGRLTVKDPSARAALMALRDDPEAASLMAAEHAADNRDALERRLGRAVGATDLYLAHFLGIGGAGRFLSALANDAGAAAADLLPRAARANRAVFFAKDGRPRTLSEIYDRFAAKLSATPAGAPPAPATAPPPPPAPSAAPAARAYAQTARMLLAELGG